MDVHFPSSRAGAAAAATALLLCTSLTAADGASSAQAVSRKGTVISGSWGAVASTSKGPDYGTGPLQLTFFAFDTRPQYFSVVNTGTIPLTAQTIRATTNSSSAVVEACSTTWNEIDGSCSSGGSIIKVITTDLGSTVLVSSLQDHGASIRLRAQPVGSNLLGSRVTINVEVTRTQARAATVSGG